MLVLPWYWRASMLSQRPQDGGRSGFSVCSVWQRPFLYFAFSSTCMALGVFCLVSCRVARTITTVVKKLLWGLEFWMRTFRNNHIQQQDRVWGDILNEISRTGHEAPLVCFWKSAFLNSPLSTPYFKVAAFLNLSWDDIPCCTLTLLLPFKDWGSQNLQGS